jgi:hypothetical protein
VRGGKVKEVKGAKEGKGSDFEKIIIAGETSQKNAEKAMIFFLDMEATAVVHIIAHRHSWQGDELPSEEFIKGVVKERVDSYGDFEKEVIYSGTYPGAALAVVRHAKSELLGRVNASFEASRARAKAKKESSGESKVAAML